MAPCLELTTLCQKKVACSTYVSCLALVNLVFWFVTNPHFTAVGQIVHSVAFVASVCQAAEACEM